MYLNKPTNQTINKMNSKLELSPSDWNSLYIPILPKDLMLDGIELNNEHTLKTYIENKLYLGKVSRIDFITKSSKYDEQAKAAFIHFEYWSDFSNDFRNYMERNGECKLKGYDFSKSFRNDMERNGEYNDGNEYGEFVSSKNPNIKRFITIKINKTPIPEAVEVPKNIHQILNNYALMEKMIEEQKQRIEELESEVTGLRNEIVIVDYENENMNSIHLSGITLRKTQENYADMGKIFMRDTLLY